MTLTHPQRQALQDMVNAKLAMWKAIAAIQLHFNCELDDIDSDSLELNRLCGTILEEPDGATSRLSNKALVKACGVTVPPNNPEQASETVSPATPSP